MVIVQNKYQFSTGKMMTKILKKLGIKEFYDKGLIARILVILCLAYIAFGIFFLTVRLVMTLSPSYPTAHWTDVLIESMILIVGIATFFMIRADNMKGASRLIMSGMFIAVALQAYFIADPSGDVGSAMGIQLFAITAVLLLDSRDRWVALILAVLVLVGLNYLYATGRLNPAITLTPSGKIMFSLFIWFSVSLIISLMIIATMGAMRREPQFLEKVLNGTSEFDGKDLSFISTHDGLTGLYNRLFFETEFNRLEKSRLYPISIIVAKILDLESIQATHGTQVADEQVMNLSSLFTNVFRQEDIVSRYGQDEFAVLLPSADADILGIVMGRLEKRLDAFNSTHMNLPLNISFGTSTAQRGESLKTHLKSAFKVMR
jgi:diguanylate cyclase (GGDEF)-like protein